MRKFVVLLLAFMIVGTTAVYADIGAVTVKNGKLDRIFDISRTLYYVDADKDGIVPEVTAANGTVIKKASTVTGNIADRYTVIKDTVTQTEYRFVMRKAWNTVNLKNFRLTSETGLLKLSAESEKPFKIFILKPKDNNSSYSLSDMDFANLENAALMISEVSGGDFEYTMPPNTDFGDYRVFIADGNGNFIEKDIYYAPLSYVNDVLAKLNALTLNDFDKFIALINENYKALNLDISDYKNLKDKRTIFKGLNGKNYKNSEELGEAFAVYTALSVVNESTDKIYLIERYSGILGITLDNIYQNLKSKTPLNGMLLNNYAEPSELETGLKAAAATQYINEATLSELPQKLSAVKDSLGISTALWASFSAIKDKTNIYYAIGNKGFTSPSNLLNAFTSAVNTALNPPQNQTPINNNGGGGGSSGGFSVNGNQNIVDNPPVTTQPQNPEPPKSTDGFIDLGGVPWARESILYLRDMGVVNGKTENTFSPDDFVTREEFVKMLSEALMLGEKGEKEPEFSDVEKTAWYSKYISIAYQNGIVNGISENVFGVGEEITRQDLCVMLYRALTVMSVKLDDSKRFDNVFAFEDIDEISDYAVDAMRILYKNGIINGVGGNKTEPFGNATRAMAAVVIYRLLKL